MKSDNNHTSIKKKQNNERQSFMYRKYQNRKNNADENFMENSETKSKAIDPCCHQLKRKLSDTSSNVNKDSKRKKINPREYWTHSKIYRKSVPSKVNIQMKSDNSHTSIKKKQGNERLSFMYRKYQNRKKNTDENFTENSETKSKAIDPYCRQLKRKLSDTLSNVNKESKRKKINPREYWTHSKICKKSVPSKVNIQMKSDNSHTGIKKKQDNERQSFMYRKYQNRKNNADENFMENSETKSKAIDPCCHQLKRKLSDTSSNVNKDSKRKKINPREYWTHSKIYRKSVPSKVNIQMKSDNSHTSIKKKQGNERLSFMYRKYQNRKNNTDENFTENSETKSKAIDPYCHQLKRKLSDTLSNVNKESKRKKINPREYWTHSKICKKSVPSKVNIQMKSDNSHTGIKKKQDNERQSFMYRKDQNRKNNADENFMENSETKSKAIDPCCHQLKRKLSDASSNVNKESKRKKINPREYWTHSKICKKSVLSKVNIQMKSDNSHTGIKKKQDNERESFMYRKYQNRKNNADENFRENSETKSKTIDPFCHQLKRKLTDTSGKKIKNNNVSPKQFKHNKTNLTNKNVVCYGKSSKIKNVKMSQKCPLQKIMKNKSCGQMQKNS